MKWTYDMDGSLYDGEFETPEEAQEAADELFAERCMEDGIKGRERFPIELVEIYTGADGGLIEGHRVAAWVEFEYEASNYKQHNVWHKGGVL